MSSSRGNTHSQSNIHRYTSSSPAGLGASRRAGYGAVAYRPAILGLAKLLFLPLASAAPILTRHVSILEETPKSPDDPNLWVYLGVAVALVLLGGAFAGLTIALMGQDETYLQVIATSGEGTEKKNAAKVLNLLGKGKHWVLVTLLLSNVITNETLPIVLDRSLGGGWPAVVSSTVLIVIFGEVAPQSVCVRYGLQIGAFMAPVVYGLMWILGIVAWPTAKLLDWLLGEDHGTMYKKAGLKTLVQLHKNLGTTPGEERLMQDEVTIINSVLDLKDKAVGDIMTPMGDVFTMSADTVLDEKMMDTILSQGYSRIPIYAPDNQRDFIGMLLVKILITYDPEDCKRVREFALATLPETAPHTSCLDIINFFQEGKSHMVLVSDFPGQDKGALGVVTLEDVIEELIGEEIVDESDVFVDAHKAIRRAAPAPRTRYHKPVVTQDDAEAEMEAKDDNEGTPLLPKENGGTAPTSRRPSTLVNGQSTTFLMRRKSSNASENPKAAQKPIPVRSNTTDLRKQLQHLGPSNMASKPRATKFQSVKIKPGVGTIPENKTTTTGEDEVGPPRSQSVDVPRQEQSPAPPATPAGGEEPEGAGLLRSAGREASDGVVAVHATGYGTMSGSPRTDQPENEREVIAEGGRPTSADDRPLSPTQSMKEKLQPPMSAAEASKLAQENTTVPPAEKPTPADDRDRRQGNEDANKLSKLVVGASKDDADDDDEIGEMEAPSRGQSKPRRTARSGSITETHVDIGGMKKVVLETTSSSDENGNSSNKSPTISGQTDGADDLKDTNGGAEDGERKKRKKKRGKKKKGGAAEGGD